MNPGLPPQEQLAETFPETTGCDVFGLITGVSLARAMTAASRIPAAAKASSFPCVIMSEPEGPDQYPIVKLPYRLDGEQVAQLAAWHREKEGIDPDSDHDTPIWVKLDNRKWAVAMYGWNHIAAMITRDINNIETCINFERHAAERARLSLRRTSLFNAGLSSIFHASQEQTVPVSVLKRAIDSIINIKRSIEGVCNDEEKDRDAGGVRSRYLSFHDSGLVPRVQG